MKQAQIQQLRKVLSAQITELHTLKTTVKNLIGVHWHLARPETIEGRAAFASLNYFRNQLRSLTKDIARLSTLTKELKKEERKLLGH